MKRIVLILFALLLSACAPSANSGSSTGSISIQDAWARPAKAGETSAIYFVVNNPSNQADTMLSVKCDAAMMAEMHKTETDASGKSSMMKQENVPVPAGGKTEFKPGGLHIMLMKLKQDLPAGQKLPFTLTFEKAGEVQVEATVREP